MKNKQMNFNNLKRNALHAVLAAVIFCGCEAPNEKNTPPQTTDVQTRYTSWSCDIKVLNIDDCEYIVAQTGFKDGGLSIVHKQNCKYCDARSKK
jgi:hypothetical protein